MQLELFPATKTRQPVCFHCGVVSGRWYQPLIGIENFCSIACTQSYTFNGQAQAIHTAKCRHFSPESAA